MVDTTRCMPRENQYEPRQGLCAKKALDGSMPKASLPMHSTVKEVNQFIDVGNYLVILLKPFYRESILPQRHKGS